MHWKLNSAVVQIQHISHPKAGEVFNKGEGACAYQHNPPHFKILQGPDPPTQRLLLQVHDTVTTN